MPEGSRNIGGAAGGDRFDGATVRRLLQRAAEEQHRLNDARADSYSLEELEEMAAEARISPEALYRAISVQRAAPGGAASDASGRAEGFRRWPQGLGRWLRARSPAVRWTLLAGAGGLAVAGLMVAFPVVAEVLYLGALLALLVLALLIVLGASPF